MALILGCGDMLHHIPRIIGHLTTGLDDYTYYLRLGKVITSFTMPFYIPVVLFLSKITAIGELMMPKILAYLHAGYITYKKI